MKKIKKLTFLKMIYFESNHFRMVETRKNKCFKSKEIKISGVNWILKGSCVNNGYSLKDILTDYVTSFVRGDTCLFSNFIKKWFVEVLVNS